MFIDRLEADVRAGKGGDGCVSFHREKFVPRGGPDGGKGGKGGDIVFYVDPGETTLVRLHSRPFFRAQNGGPGQPNNKTGRNGPDVRVPVPPGTIVRDCENGWVICELVEVDASAVVAAGGKGGKGNSSFATPTNQVPRKAEPGRAGEERRVVVELKIVADVGLVGFPNAGKSTLLNALTSARAKIGDYPFTTLNPVLGTIPLTPEEEAEYRGARDGESPPFLNRPRVIIADIPGIIEGAHHGAGLGLQFLRHIERTNVLLFVIDVSVNREYEPLEAYRSLIQEIGSYDEALLERPRLLVLSKVDNPLEPDEIDSLTSEFESTMKNENSPSSLASIHRVSALEGSGLEGLRAEIVRWVARVHSAEPE